jgi:hypothetical protein
MNSLADRDSKALQREMRSREDEVEVRWWWRRKNAGGRRKDEGGRRTACAGQVRP